MAEKDNKKPKVTIVSYFSFTHKKLSHRETNYEKHLTYN